MGPRKEEGAGGRPLSSIAPLVSTRISQERQGWGRERPSRPPRRRCLLPTGEIAISSGIVALKSKQYQTSAIWPIAAPMVAMVGMDVTLFGMASMYQTGQFSNSVVTVVHKATMHRYAGSIGWTSALLLFAIMMAVRLHLGKNEVIVVGC